MKSKTKLYRAWVEVRGDVCEIPSYEDQAAYVPIRATDAIHAWRIFDRMRSSGFGKLASTEVHIEPAPKWLKHRGCRKVMRFVFP